MIALSKLMLAKRADDQVVALDGENHKTWRDFYHSVVLLSSTLNARSEQRWLLFEEDSYRFAIGLMALLHSGKTIVLPPNAQPGTLGEWAQQCDALLGVKLEGTNCLDITPDQDPRLTVVPFQVLDDQHCHIEVITSGSSGKPVQISKSLSCFEQELVCQYQLWSEQLQGSVVVSTVSHQHIYGLLFRLMLPLCCGIPFWRSSHQYPEALFNDVQRHCPKAVLISSPAHLGRIPTAIDLALVKPQMALIFSSGGPLALPSSQYLQQELGLAPVEIFGSTETGGVAWRRQLAEDQPWKVFSGIALRINPNNQQLQIDSPFCTKGNDSAEPNWYQMSDVVELIDDNQLLLRGRADRVIKLEEKRLSLTQMEQRLEAMAWVERAKLLVLPTRRKQLAAVLILTSEGQQLLQQQGKRALNEILKAQLLQFFERVLLPRKWRYLEDFPTNSQGKTPLADLEILFSKDD